MNRQLKPLSSTSQVLCTVIAIVSMLTGLTLSILQVSPVYSLVSGFITMTIFLSISCHLRYLNSIRFSLQTREEKFNESGMDFIRNHLKRLGFRIIQTNREKQLMLFQRKDTTIVSSFCYILTKEKLSNFYKDCTDLSNKTITQPTVFYSIIENKKIEDSAKELGIKLIRYDDIYSYGLL